MTRAAMAGMIAAGLAAAVPAGAQAPTAADAAASPVAVVPDHWIYHTLDRMAAAGLMDGVWLRGRRPAGADAILAALDSATARSGPAGPWSATTAAARDRFLAEYARGGTSLSFRPLLATRYLEGPLAERRGEAGMAVGVGTGARWSPVPRVALWAVPVVELTGDGVEVPTPRLGAAGVFGRVRLAASYDALRLGPGATGGAVAGGEARLARIEIGTASPVAGGRVHVSFAASRLGPDDLGPGVAFVEGELRVWPHPRLGLGATRTLLLASSFQGDRIDAVDLLYEAIGKHTRYGDSRSSLTAEVRVDVLGVRLAPYGELGFEDSAGIHEDPGLILGLWLPSLTVGPAPLGVRYEYVGFGSAGRIFGGDLRPGLRRNWYRHPSPPRAEYVDGADRLLGHPLGGYGSEHRVEATTLVDRLHLALAFYARHREPENLRADVFPGASRGGRAGGSLALGRYTASAGLEVERGEGWSRTEVVLTVNLLP